MESSSTSKGPIVAKVLVDLSEYKALKEAQKFKELHENKLSEKYKSDVKSGSGEEDVIDNTSQERECDNVDQHHGQHHSSTQVGLGSITDLKEFIVSTIGNCLKEALVKQFKDYFSPQVGGTGGILPTQPVTNLTDLAQPLAPPEPLDNAQRMSGYESLVKSDLNSEINEELLLTKIPKKFHERAKKLLEAIDVFSTIITWNKNGVLFLDGQSIPQSNIFKLMPEVFKFHPDHALPGFPEFVSKIASLGLGALINRTILRGLNRTKKIENQKDLYDYVTSNKANWYYIGR